MTKPIHIQRNQMREDLDYVKKLLAESQEIQSETQKILVAHAEQNRQNIGAINYLAMIVAKPEGEE